MDLNYFTQIISFFYYNIIFIRRRTSLRCNFYGFSIVILIKINTLMHIIIQCILYTNISYGIH